jgi:hypothetical protein
VAGVEACARYPGLGRRRELSQGEINQVAKRPVKAPLAAMILVVVVPFRMVMFDPVVPVGFPPIPFVPYVMLIVVANYRWRVVPVTRRVSVAVARIRISIEASRQREHATC